MPVRVSRGASRNKKRDDYEDDSPDANTSTEEENNECKLDEAKVTFDSRL